MLYLAMSMFQGQTQNAALDGLLPHAPDGVQLTPGNLPSEGFRDRMVASTIPTRLHHGFAWDAYRRPVRPVYSAEGLPIDVQSDRSVHPPRSEPRSRRRSPAGPGPEQFIATPDLWLEVALAHDLLLETMMPGWVLGCGRHLELAMDLGIRLAVDVSHLEIQRRAGVLGEATVRRLQRYVHVEEMHVSASRGRHDTHAPLQANTPGLCWARARMGDLPVVLESYWHKLSLDEQRRQLDLLRS